MAVVNALHFMLVQYLLFQPGNSLIDHAHINCYGPNRRLWCPLGVTCLCDSLVLQSPVTSLPAGMQSVRTPTPADLFLKDVASKTCALTRECVLFCL